MDGPGQGKRNKAHAAPPSEEFLGAELLALSYLCRHWAKRQRDRRPFPKASENAITLKPLLQKADKLREAVIHPMGGRDYWEYEFLDDEIKTMQHIVNEFAARKRAAEGRPVLFPVAPNLTIARPIPGPMPEVWNALGLVDDNRSSKTAIAKRMVAVRLGIKPDTLEDALRDKRDRSRRRGRRPHTNTTPAQRLAVSILYDLHLNPITPRSNRLRGRILDALLASRYPPILLYYLIQKLQLLKRPKQQFRVCSAREVARICARLECMRSKPGAPRICFRGLLRCSAALPVHAVPPALPGATP